jgi:hypothetical protein
VLSVFSTPRVKKDRKGRGGKESAVERDIESESERE